MLVAEINPIAFHLIGLPIHWYALIIVTGIVLAVLLASREAVNVGLKEEDITDFVLWALPLAFIGARLYYVLFEWPYYAQHPAEIIAIWQGGIAIYGGLISGAIVLFFFTRNRFIDTWQFLDVAVPGVLLAQAIGRWGNFANHEAHGRITTKAFLEGLHLPDFIIQNMYISGAYRQPTFLYESFWSLLGFLFLIGLRYYGRRLRLGDIACSYLMWYSFGRFFIEGMRTDSLMIGNVIRVSQVLSIVLFVGALVLFIVRHRQATTAFYTRTKRRFI